MVLRWLGMDWRLLVITLPPKGLKRPNPCQGNASRTVIGLAEELYRGKRLLNPVGFLWCAEHMYSSTC